MKSRTYILSLIMLSSLSISGCGMEVEINGRVVDAKTGLPVEGAAVAIKWVHHKLGPPGLGSDDVDLGTTETLTDPQGNFTIPRYIGRSHYMSVYKKGYICWNSEDTFNPYGKTYEEMYKRRFWHRVRDGMVIRLEPMPEDISTENRELHAHFTVDVDTRLNPTLIFSKAIQLEEDLHRQILRRNSKRGK